MREVEQIYFEDAAHAGRVLDFFLMRKSSKNSAELESYYVRLVDPRHAHTVIGAVEGMPGVAEAAPVVTR
ncbi:hypothetical protein GCM10010466_05060 [Planomonospora alba]|uniref:Uncharacterized protein n=1 Tax=Planomonospora alba TaxID=161354 RepID=A0ABP6MLW9_9ACTN